ncbi:MAG: hypothetical protein GPOALKHO_000909 [Sodalis sp.]|nr:MAG: hypothetical protein GPOALKHO_000909 [Sodalis sp.]
MPHPVSVIRRLSRIINLILDKSLPIAVLLDETEFVSTIYLKVSLIKGNVKWFIST